MHLETERLIIRDFKLSDIDYLYEIFSEDEVMEYIEPVYDRNKTLNFIKEFCIEHKGAFACANRENEKVIGYIIFNEYEDKVYELGWIFNKEYWGKGYAYESCDAVIKYAFSEMKIHKIFAETIDNIKSVNLMKKLGMQLEGIQKSHTTDNHGNWKDVYLYGLLEK